MRDLCQWSTAIKNFSGSEKYDVYCLQSVPALKGLIHCGVFVEQFARSNHGYSQGMAVKRIIRTKLVDVTKLVSDLHFVAEIDRQVVHSRVYSTFHLQI